MSDVQAYLLVAALLAMLLPILVDDMRYRYFPAKWACGKCNHPLIEANGASNIFDGRKGFRCPSCNHVMHAHRSKATLICCIALSVATTLGCAVILCLDLNPDKLGMTWRPVYHFVYVGVILGPCLAGYAAYLLRQLMPVKRHGDSD